MRSFSNLPEAPEMAFRKRRDVLRSILSGSACIRPGSVYDAISIRIAHDLGFQVGMFGGSVASLAVLGDPDIALITLTELAEQMRRMSRAATLPQAFGQTATQLISLEEGVGKMKAAVDARDDPALVIMARTGAVLISGLNDAIA